MSGGSVMPPRPLSSRPAPGAVATSRPDVPAGGRPARQPSLSVNAGRIKVLQSSRAPGQLSLFSTPEPVQLR